MKFPESARYWESFAAAMLAPLAMVSVASSDRPSTDSNLPLASSPDSHTHSRYGNVVTEAQMRLIEIYGHGNSLAHLACRLEVPSADEHSNVGVPLAKLPDSSAPYETRSSSEKYRS
jgi:hypothetical protein